MIKSEYFEIHELIPELMYHQVKEEVLWRMIPTKLIETIDAIKYHFPNGTMMINNYEWGGDRHWSGLRLAGQPFYSSTSQHSYLKATDSVFNKYNVYDIRKYIIKNPHKFPHIGGLELNVSWLHTDIRDKPNGKVIAFGKR
jgi:hypothetical protein